MRLYTGIVENRIDPLNLGRCQVRIVGLHTHDKAQLPTADLPWAYPMQPVTSAAMNGIGYTPIGPVEGTSVVIMFTDVDLQQPVMLGTIGGISTTPGIIETDTAGLPSSTQVEQIKLRTIDGPVTGTKLTFVDKENGSTDLTSSLTANMKVYGFDIPAETKIVSIVSGTEIIISNPVTSYGENIISFGAAPTNLDAVTKSLEQGFLVDSSGQPVLSAGGGIVKANAAEANGAAAAVESTPVNNAIPTVPPAKSTPDQAKSSAGIRALIAACDKVGLTTKEQKCALLGIAGGESRWIPQLENYNYSSSRMKQIYKFATDDDVNRYSDAKKKGLSREEFFSWAYGPTKRGKGFLGNLTDDDGGKYFGRGFIQLTGRANYAKYQKLANNYGVNIDIVNNPDSLDEDINVSALVAALYIKDRVSPSVSPNAHPGYFLAAKAAVGVNSPDISALKQNYYEYFYGASGTGGEVKDAGAPIPQPPSDGDSSTPRPSEESVKSGSANIGFRDPNNKYPLKSYINEVDTNRLARGVIEGTIVKTKDSTRATGIPKAIDNGVWDQPLAPYGAKYPYNKVFESESGHIQEFDDTPGQERIHTFHRAGTYTEVDPNGTQVNYIVGDNFMLMERNGCIHVAGECNITVDGNLNVFARTDANIEVSQNANIRVGNNVDIGVANDVTMAVGGDYSVKVAGDYSIQAANIYQKSDDVFKVDATGDLSQKIGADYSVDVGGVVSMQSAAEVNVLGQAVNVESSGEMNILSGGTMHMDYSQGHFGNGAGSAATNDVSDLPNVQLTPPPAGDPVNPAVPYLIPPERQFEELTVAETPDDYETPEGRAAAAESTRKEGVVGAPAPTSSEESRPSGGVDSKIPVSCDIIYNTTNFTNDFRLSKNFTLGMLIDGGVNGKHKLVDQILRESKGGAERLFKVQEIVCNLANVAQNILEPALEVLPGGIGGWKTQWKINSGYRMRGTTSNESPTSDHPKGRALDIGILLPDKYTKTYEIIQKLEKIVNYDQLILEYRYPSSCWIHVSYNANGGRKMAFTMVNDKTHSKSIALVDNIPPKQA